MKKHYLYCSTIFIVSGLFVYAGQRSDLAMFTFVMGWILFFFVFFAEFLSWFFKDAPNRHRHASVEKNKNS